MGGVAASNAIDGAQVRTCSATPSASPVVECFLRAASSAISSSKVASWMSSSAPLAASTVCVVGKQMLLLARHDSRHACRDQQPCPTCGIRLNLGKAGWF